MTYRERREARAERLRGWAEKREQRAGAVLKSHEHYRGDYAFNTQPGHIPERARVIRQEDRAFESLRKAQSMNERAGSIEAATDHAIYNDDDDATARLRERIAGLEAERDRIKAYNKSCKVRPDPSLLDDHQQATLRSIMKVTAYSLGKKGEMPGYATTNLSGNIRRYKERLAKLTGAPTGKCRNCGYAQRTHVGSFPCEGFVA
jgi:hypothetical protein